MARERNPQTEVRVVASAIGALIGGFITATLYGRGVGTIAGGLIAGAILGFVTAIAMLNDPSGPNR